MSTVAEIQASLIIARSMYSTLNSQYIAEFKRGCINCAPKNYNSLRRLIKGLEWEVSKGVVNDIAEVLYGYLLLIINGYSVEVPPSVNAGANQSVELGETVIFTAVGTPGSSPIVSYLWVQTSGTPATLTNANTASVSVSNYPLGAITLKVTVTDQNGLTDSDSAQLTGIAASLIGYWWLSDEGDAPLTESEILEQTEFNFVDGGDMTVAFTGVIYKVLNIAYPDTQHDRVFYININNPDDEGSLGGETNLLGDVIDTGIFKQQNGNYLVNSNRTLKFS